MKPASEPLAHLDVGASAVRSHLLVDHLRKVAMRAGTAANAFGAQEWAYTAGLWHDLGKYALNFQRMIREANGFEAHLEGKTPAPGKPTPRDHSTAGALYACQQLPQEGTPLAFCIAGHHGGLADYEQLKERLEHKKELLQNALGQKPHESILHVPSLQRPTFAGRTGKDFLRAQEMWIRFLFSCLVDGDFLDTESFYNGDKSAARQSCFSIAELSKTIATYIDRLSAGAAKSEVNDVRREIALACRAGARRPPGVFTLTVPTGGGKTLTAMDFALKHANAHGLNRVIVAIPYTSIIEQNAEVYRSVFPEGAVIEHHSALDPDDHRSETAKSRLASENWDARVVVTTTVQLFESLFANRTSACRKLHRLAKSVIVLDEVQTLPPGRLRPILDALNTLVADYGTSIVLSTATQPALVKSIRLHEGIKNARELVPSTIRAFSRLQRVKVEFPTDIDAEVSYEELANEVGQLDDCLAIVHLRKDARVLTELIDEYLSDVSTAHLSALMFPEHRAEVLTDINARKHAGMPVRVVSTPLVEAGVDLDFPIVYRALAGLDSLAQAAGRCNREGKLDGLGELRVFCPQTRPPKGVAVSARDIARGMIKQNPMLNIFAPETQFEFFRQLYEVQNLNKDNIQEGREAFKFKQTAMLFKLIENDWAAPLVIPLRETATSALDDIRRHGISRTATRRLQRHTVNVPRLQRDRWVEDGLVEVIEDAIFILRPTWAEAAYSNRFGLVPDAVGIASPGSLVL